MIYTDLNTWISPTRRIEAEVELYKSSTASFSGVGVYITDICTRNPDIKCTVKNTNLLPFPYYDKTKTENGITFTVNEDGTVIVNGTATANTIFYFTFNSISLAPGDYVYSCSNFIENPLTSKNELRAELKNVNGSIEKYLTHGYFRIEEPKLFYPYLLIIKGNSYNNAVFYPMLSLSSFYTGYEMYVPHIEDLRNIKVIANGKTYEVNADGSVEGIKPEVNTLEIYTEPEGMVTDVTYNCYNRYKTANSNDYIKSITVERAGSQNKFYGFGVCQKANVHLIDINRALNVAANDYINIGFNNEYVLPKYYVTEVHRDENTNEISATAYDVLYTASEHTSAELELITPYTLYDVAYKCAKLIGCNTVDFSFELQEAFNLTYDNGANLEGTETIREVLDSIAEATQSIYFINYENNLIFKRLDKDGEPEHTITKDNYITLDSKSNRRLTAIVSVTELGDNVGVSLDASGTTQYIRNNPFLELREDLPQLLENALDIMGGLTINQFECSWRGLPHIEPGDKIAMVAKDDSIVYSYLINDTLEYTGAFAQKTSWIYEDSGESESNPTSLGEALKLTFAKVDKANQNIEIVAAETTALKLNADNITATVTDLTNTVNAKVTANDVNIAIKNELAEGVNKVITSTGFTFNDEGLRITKTDSEIETLITEDGMKIYKDNSEVLTADNEGVKATDLHATTYLVIGRNSRFEDYKGSRTACFWIG